MKKYLWISVMAVVIVSTMFAPAMAQEANEAAVPAAAAIAAPSQPEDLSIYGEVQSVNATANSILVQYYDYDSDEEKTSDIVLAKDAKIENASAIGDIKQGDWVDVAYSISDGKNIATSVIVEKEDYVLTEEPASAEPIISPDEE